MCVCVCVCMSVCGGGGGGRGCVKEIKYCSYILFLSVFCCCCCFVYIIVDLVKHGVLTLVSKILLLLILLSTVHRYLNQI